MPATAHAPQPQLAGVGSGEDVYAHGGDRQRDRDQHRDDDRGQMMSHRYDQTLARHEVPLRAVLELGPEQHPAIQRR